MGAAASIRQMYANAFQWFRTYFDESLYIDDFNGIDVDHSGGITLAEFDRWIHEKINHNHSDKTLWAFIATTPDVVKYAYHFSARRHPNVALFPNERIVTISDFRDLLIHLFAISILWVHFKNADDWKDGQDMGNLELNLEEFKLACYTITSAHGKETLTEEQLERDFKIIDLDASKSLDFFEVCEHCCSLLEFPKKRATYEQFENFAFEKMCQSSKTTLAIADSDKGRNCSCKLEAVLSKDSQDNDVENYIRRSILQDLQTATSIKFHNVLISADKKTDRAMENLYEHYLANKGIAEFVEVKYNTEREITRMLYGETQVQLD